MANCDLYGGANCMTIKEFFETYAKNIKLTCKDKFRVMENALYEFYEDYHRFNRNTASVPLQSGNNVITTAFPVYDIAGFYTECAPECSDCYDEVTNSCGKVKYQIRMNYVGETETLFMGEYNFCMGLNTIKVHAPNRVQGNSYIQYYKGFSLDPDIDEDNCIPVPRNMLYILKKLIMRDYVLLKGDMYQGQDQAYKADYNEYITKAKDRAGKMVHILKNKQFI